MSDITHEAPDRIWIWGWRADSVWQEQTWQHEDEPMSTMEYVRFDLMETAEQQGYANAMEAERKLHEDRIEALTKERDEAYRLFAFWRAEADRLTEHNGRACVRAETAEDRIEELEAKLAKAEVINGLLTVVAILNDPNDERFPEAVDLAERFSATLAEISSHNKGESHE